MNPKTFLKVLEGDADLASKGKKVLQSTSKDHVFVYFSDHGAPGLIAFPDSELLATDLMKTLHKLKSMNRFNKMVFYIEACESGSMFASKLLPDLKILGVTAAGPDEPSYACYWDDERETFLGDLFSVEWIEDSESQSDLDRETVQTQYAHVKKLTNQSQVMEYGDVTIGRLPVGQFQGEVVTEVPANRKARPMVTDAVPSHDVPLIIAEKRIAKAADKHQKMVRTAAYEGMKAGREYMSHTVSLLARRMTEHLPHLNTTDLLSERKPLTRHECYEQLYRAFDAHCFDISSHPYALKYLYVFVNVCEGLNSAPNQAAQINLMTDVLAEECKKHVSEHPFKSIL